MNQHYKELIAQEFLNCVNNTFARMESNPTRRPFHSALLSDEVLLWSRFERSFSTSFGQRTIEEMAKLVALSNGAAEAERQHITNINLSRNYADAITRHIQNLRNGHHEGYEWSNIVDSIKALEPGEETVPIRVISDLWWIKDGINYYCSLKTVKPNIDQSAVAKEDCLHLVLADDSCKAYFGLPYNPYGDTKESYAFNPPMGIFDFRHDDVVLIGKELWDTIGGDGCYEEILEIARNVGQTTKVRFKDYL